MAAPLEGDFVAHIAQAGYALVSFDAAVAFRAARLTAEHRDPFDRIIAAHALAEDIPVTSPDRKPDLFGVRRIW